MIDPPASLTIDSPTATIDLDSDAPAAGAELGAPDLIRVDRVRGLWAIGVNMIAPGAGLAILRREWFGLTIAVLFALLAQTAAYGLLIDPTAVRDDVAKACVVAAGAVWFVAQGLTIARMRRVLGARSRREIAVIVEQVSEALAARRFADAIDLLNVALCVNDESIDLRVALARVLTLTGRFDDARSAWEAVLDLDVDGAYRAEATTAMDRLPRG